MEKTESVSTSNGELPNFLIIGAAKAGTTSLFDMLAAHPSVFRSPVKETGFFSNDARFENGPDWYLSNYFRDSHSFPVRLEASPAYLTWSEKVAPRLRDTFRGLSLRFAAIFRDPVYRAYSHYWHHVRMSHEPLSFEQALAEEPGRLKQLWNELYRAGNGRYGYFRAGCYASRLRPFLECFPIDRFFLLIQEDIFPERLGQTIPALLSFLEIDPAIPLRAVRANRASTPRSRWFTRLYWGLKKTYLKPLYRERIPAQIRERIQHVLFPPAEYPPMDPEVEQLLRLQYADEVRQLEDILQRDLGHWLPS